MIDTLLICVTVLILAAGTLWFATKFLTTSKAREEALVARIDNAVHERVKKVETSIAEAHAKVDAAEASFRTRIAQLVEKQASLVGAFQLAAQQNRMGAVREAWANRGSGAGK